MSSRNVEIEVRSGTCATHGSVEATREIPRMGFPFAVFAVRRWVARRKPFVCPECEQPVT
jgi:hypothetical protein